MDSFKCVDNLFSNYDKEQLELRLIKLEEQAISFIKIIAKNVKEPLYAGNSGGKDSAVLDFLLQKSNIKYTSIYANTTIDPPKTIQYIKKHYPHTQILQPKETFLELVERKGLPTRLTRFCCEKLKEYVSIGRYMFEGVRSSESRNRQKRDYIQCDNRKWQKGAKHIYPIYDWTDQDVYAFIEKYKIPLAPCYQYQKRLGCVGCPLVTRKGAREREFKLYPAYFYAIKKSIIKGMKNNPQWKLSQLTKGDGEVAMRWWLSGKTMNEYFKITKK